MSTVTEVRNALIAALRALDTVRVSTSPGMSLDPPTAVVGVPELTWERFTDPSSATFVVGLAVAANEHAADRLLALYPDVVAALDGVPGVVVKSAAPGTVPAGSAELPAYLIEIEVAL